MSSGAASRAVLESRAIPMGVTELSEYVASWLGIAQEGVTRVGASLLVLIGYVVARRVVARTLVRRFDDTGTRYRFSKASQAVLGGVAIFIIVKIWFGQLQFGTYFGLVSAGVAVALQDPLVNLAGWLYLIVRRPFGVGDRIQVGPHAGDVVDLQLFSIALLEIGNWVQADQSTGRILHIPNGWVFKHPIASYEQGFPYIWNEIPVTVTFESDWRLAKATLQRVLDKNAETVAEGALHQETQDLAINYARTTPIVWTSTAPEGVMLTMRYLCRPRERRASNSRMWEAVLDAFDELPSVHLAYPTTRFYDASREPAVKVPGGAAPLADARSDDPAAT